MLIPLVMDITLERPLSAESRLNFSYWTSHSEGITEFFEYFACDPLIPATIIAAYERPVPEKSAPTHNRLPVRPANKLPPIEPSSSSPKKNQICQFSPICRSVFEFQFTGSLSLTLNSCPSSAVLLFRFLLPPFEQKI